MALSICKLDGFSIVGWCVIHFKSVEIRDNKIYNHTTKIMAIDVMVANLNVSGKMCPGSRDGGGATAAAGLCCRQRPLPGLGRYCVDTLDTV